VTLARSVRVTQVPWKALVGIGGVVGGLIMLGVWNTFGLWLATLPTNLSYGTYAALGALAVLLAGVSAALLIVLVLGAAGPLYRDLAPERVSIAHLLTFRSMRSREFFTSTLIGYGMAGAHIGFLVLLYVIARRLGAWAPLDVKYTNAISTAAPWITPLSDSVWAATSEEFIFRLLAIPMLLRWFARSGLRSWSRRSSGASCTAAIRSSRRGSAASRSG